MVYSIVRLYCASVCFVIFCVVHFNAAHYVSRNHPDVGCPESQCNSGECIEEHQFCDGKSDCRDNSDETEESCLAIPCHRTTYRCKYGACIKRSAKCDGIKDCFDGSDEANCAVPVYSSSAQIPHLSDKFLCKSGEFIPKHRLCDGKPDCYDSSDETASVCLDLACPRPGFRCKYGACIRRKFVCDGSSNCLDGSDEKDCITHEVRPSTTTKGSHLIVNCLVPNNPEHGEYRIGGQEAQNFKIGDVVPAFSVLVTHCDDGYQASPANKIYSVCANGIWTPVPSICSRFPQAVQPANSGVCECHCPLIFIK